VDEGRWALLIIIGVGQWLCRQLDHGTGHAKCDHMKHAWIVLVEMEAT